MAVVGKLFAEHETLITTAVNDWQEDLHFNSVEAAIEGIETLSIRAPRETRGVAVEDNTAFLTLCSGLGVYYG